MDAQLERKFVEIMTNWLVSLPHDLKILFDAMDDENLDRSARELCVGAIIYAISANDFVADRHDSFTSYVDDAIMLHLALSSAMNGGDEDREYFKTRYPDFFENLESEIAVCRETMGDLFDWLERKVSVLGQLEYKGKKVPRYLDDDDDRDLLFEDGLGFRTEYPIEEESLGDRLKKTSTVLDVIRRRRDEESRGSRG